MIATLAVMPTAKPKPEDSAESTETRPFPLRLPESLYLELQAEAAADQRSMNKLAEIALGYGLRVLRVRREAADAAAHRFFADLGERA
jgi:hypothetical protein